MINWFDNIKNELSKIYEGKITEQSTEAEVQNALEDIAQSVSPPPATPTAGVEEKEESTTAKDYASDITVITESMGVFENRMGNIETMLNQLNTVMEQVANSVVALAPMQDATTTLAASLQDVKNELAAVKDSFASELVDIKTNGTVNTAGTSTLNVKTPVKVNNTAIEIKSSWLDDFLGTSKKD